MNSGTTLFILMFNGMITMIMGTIILHANVGHIEPLWLKWLCGIGCIAFGFIGWLVSIIRMLQTRKIAAKVGQVDG